jgi:DNA-binding transcriptional ArsR family regulator
MVKSKSEELDQLFHALSDTTRRAILWDLGRQEKTVSEIALPYRMSLAAVSKHLKVLEMARLIDRRKEGSYQYVRLRPKTLRTVREWLSYYERFWNDRLELFRPPAGQDESNG